MRLIWGLILAGLLYSVQALAEPYLAVRTNQPCSSCHLNQSGGGLRTSYGSIYAQTTLPAHPAKDPSKSITALFDEKLLLGANARGSGSVVDVDNREDASEFEIDCVTLYLAAELNAYTTLYLDQQVAPGGSLNREAFALFKKDAWYLKAGKFFLPFGWRLEDDTAFIRQATGINFNNPDNGVEVGYQKGHWNMQVALTNGSAGAGEQNDGKQGSFKGEFIGDIARAGLSVNHNNTDIIDRTMYGVFAGLQTGDVSWLLEWDRLEDAVDGQPDQKTDVALLEANYLVSRGHNLKLTFESMMPDGKGMDDVYRGSIVWEFFPWAFTQVRAGYRQFDSDDENPLNNREEAFIQIHLFF